MLIIKKWAALLVIGTIFLSPNFFVSSSASDVYPQFYITLLSPNTNPARNQWAALMEQQLPEIGIGVKFHESTGWSNIIPRTWEYPVGQEYDYIPTYDEGGYDILFVGWSWGLDWDPTNMFSSASIVPNGDNVYQYSNLTFDQALIEYTTTLDPTVRLQKVKVLQQILYEDLPAITIIYPRSLFGMKEGLTGIDPLLLASSSARYEYWGDPADHKIVYAIPAELTEYNIYVQESYYDAQWMAAVYAGLFARAQDSHLFEPLIAKNYTISADGRDITVDISPNAKFSDGNPVTADDVKYTYQLHMTPAVGSSSYGYLTYFLESNDSIEVVDQDTLIFHLKQPYGFALDLLSCGIIEKSKVETAITMYGYDIFGEVPLTGNVKDTLVTSCGPFMLTDYDAANSIVTLEPNPYYVGDAPKLQTLIILWINGKDTAIAELAAGNVDIVDSNFSPLLSDYEGVAGVDAILVKDPGTQEMAINMKHPYLGTGELTPVGTPEAAKWIRQAISHATPRQTIVDQILQGLGAPGVIPMPDASVGFDDTLQPYSYDLDLARQYMQKAGFDLSSMIFTVTPTNTNNTDTNINTTTSNESSAVTIKLGINNLLLLSFISLCFISSIWMKRLLSKK